MSNDDERQFLLEKLARACVVYEQGENVDSKRDAHLLSAIAVYNFLIADGFPPAALVPFQNLIHDIGTHMWRRRASQPGGKVLLMGLAAAAVTVLRQRGKSLDASLKTVAKATRFDQTKLKSFRDNISRGRVKDRLALISYECGLVEIGAMSHEEIERALRLWSAPVT